MVERFSGEWKTVKLGEIVQIIRGVSYSERDVHRAKLNGDCLILRGGNVLENGHITITDSDNVYVNGSIVSDKQRIRKNDVVIVSSTASMRVIGKSGVIDSDYENVAPGAFLLLIRPLKKPDVFAPYVSWYFMTETYRNNIKRLVAGGVIQNIKMEHINDLIITLPPLEEQHAIADTLSAFDRHISALSALIAKKQAVRQGALEDLMTGRTRLEGFCGSWKTVKLLDVVRLVQGLTYKPEDVDSHGTLVLRSSNIQDNKLSLENNVYVRARISKEKMIQEGDILVCVRNGSANLIGKNCILPAMSNTTFGAFMSVLRGDTTGFIAKVFESSIVQKQLRGRTSATINQITKKDFESITIPLPPMDEQLAISSVLSALDSELSALNSERAKFSAIRQAAISDLLTGKIRLERTAH
ncbi:MAG: restriction endonuclease subunit S [Synergistaceae bacterium]|nr:restriction endonuclease subunit S [Synergistaceae bacterium]